MQLRLAGLWARTKVYDKAMLLFEGAVSSGAVDAWKGSEGFVKNGVFFAFLRRGRGKTMACLQGPFGRM